MNRKKVIYHVLLLTVLAFSLVFEFIEDSGLIPEFNALTLYIYRYASLIVSYLTIFGCFTFMKSKPVLMQILLFVSMLLVLGDYYLNFASDDRNNILVTLPLLLVMYVLKYKAIAK